MLKYKFSLLYRKIGLFPPFQYFFTHFIRRDIRSKIDLYLDIRFYKILFSILKEKNILPSSQNDIFNLSLQYQVAWRFEKEKRLMLHAFKLYPDWNYVLKRLEWHSRSEFHKDPEKSKVQPRKLLYSPFNLKNIPHSKTIKNLCFVTASGSDEPYFSLSIQLLESLKATPHYSKVPVKILDCGLTPKDAQYLIQKFNVDIKDPGWDVPPSFIKNFKSKKNGWKGCTARPFIHQHFPGYEYYFWVDTDTWVKDEAGLNELVCLCEKQGIGAIMPEPRVWRPYDSFWECLPKEMRHVISGKSTVTNCFYCIKKSFAEKHAKQAREAIKLRKKYIWGFDYCIFNYSFYYTRAC
jgi:hypothetical protein